MGSEQPLSVVQAMIAVMRDVDAIGKDRRNDMQKFNFRGIDDVQNALHPLMAKHGVICVPTVVQEERETRATKNGGDMNVVHLWVQFTFYGPAGDVITAVVAGEAQDSGDKATNKALSAALKYCLLQTFMIPTEDSQDADASGEAASSSPAPRPAAPRPQNAPQQPTAPHLSAPWPLNAPQPPASTPVPQLVITPAQLDQVAALGSELGYIREGRPTPPWRTLLSGYGVQQSAALSFEDAARLINQLEDAKAAR